MRHGKRPEVRMANWGVKHLEWIKQKVHFDQPALEATLQDYVREVEHAGEHISGWRNPLSKRCRIPHR